jgi:hypothetical protein
MMRKTEPVLGGCLAVGILLKMANVITAPWWELILFMSVVVLLLEAL